MKIGILTFHRACNYGAFLQCYSLQRRLSFDFPEAQVEVIDYASENMLHSYKLSRWESIFGIKGSPKPSVSIIIKRILLDVVKRKYKKNKSLQNKSRLKNFEKAPQYLPLSEYSLISDSPEEFAKFLNDKYDIIVVGSDAIWNDNQTSWPNLYLLHDIKCKHKFSYAASTYGMDFSCLSEDKKRYLNEAFSQFCFIGTRDVVTEEYVKLCDDSAAPKLYHTCDPSLFLKLDELPVDMDLLRKKLESKGVDFSRPIIGLMCDNWLAKEVRKNLGEKYQYVSVYVFAESADIFLNDLEPFEWARVFSLFDVTFTHYFHGTLFSLKNGTLTYSIEKRSSYNKKYKTKIQDVLSRLDIDRTNCFLYENMTQDSWKEIKHNVSSIDKITFNMLIQEKISEEAKSYNRFASALTKEINLNE